MLPIELVEKQEFVLKQKLVDRHIPICDWKTDES